MKDYCAVQYTQAAVWWGARKKWFEQTGHSHHANLTSSRGAGSSSSIYD